MARAVRCACLSVGYRMTITHVNDDSTQSVYCPKCGNIVGGIVNDVSERNVFDPQDPMMHALLPAGREKGAEKDKTAVLMLLCAPYTLSGAPAPLPPAPPKNDQETGVHAPPLEVNEEVVRAEREASYGNPLHNLNAAALIVQGLLENHWQMKLPPIEPRIMALIMTGVKISRSAHTGKHSEDTLFDAKVYINIAEELDGRNKS